ncbi:MAG: ABC transporter substrate-binding protein [Spirochaetota bacterium]
MLQKRGILLSFILLTVFACKKAQPGDSTGKSTSVQYAKGFDLQQTSGQDLLVVKQISQKITRSVTYLLLQRGEKVPADLAYDKIIRLPIRKVICLSAPQVAFLTALGEQKRIQAITSISHIYNEEIHRRKREGKVQEVGSAGNLNLEKIISISPDVVFVEIISPADIDKFSILERAGISVVYISDWLEHTPLGRAEWLRLYGALFSKEKLAGEIFTKVEQEYKQVLAKVSTIKKKPGILVNFPFKGVWYMPGGKSYMARLFQDARASYHWSGTTNTGSIPLDFESVLPVAIAAEFWISPGFTKSLQQLFAKEKRVKYFTSFQKKQIYNNHKRIRKEGGNDYWESGVVSPHILLQDLVKILHPQLLPEYSLYYFNRLE